MASKEKWLREARRNTRDKIARYDLELSYARDYIDDTLLWIAPGGNLMIVGYTLHDDSCYNPINDSEGQGEIITEKVKYYWHIGLDQEYMPDLTAQFDLLQRLKGEHVNRDGSPDYDAAMEMWREAAKRGKVGTPFARALEQSYDGAYREVDFDDDGINAVWIPDKALIEHLETVPEERRRDDAKTIFEGILEEYNKWVTGDTWGVVIEYFERDGDHFERLDSKEDSCWGYIGSEYAADEMESLIQWHRRNYLNEIKKRRKAVQENRTSC